MRLRLVCHVLVFVSLCSLVGCGGGGGEGAPADTVAPSVTIASPINNSLASGTILVDVAASDNVGVAKVELYQGAILLGTLTTGPYLFDWDTTNLINSGSYTLTAKAYDAAGNVNTSPATIIILREVKIRTVGLATNIRGVEVSVNVPAGVNLNPIPIPGVPNDFSHATTVGVGDLANLFDTNNIPPLLIIMTFSGDVGAGDLVALNCTFPPGSIMHPADFSIVPNSFVARDVSGVPVDGVIAEIY